MKKHSPDIRIEFTERGVPEDGLLTCAHCGLPHPVTLAMQAKYEERARDLRMPVSKIWHCGACYLAHMNRITRDLGLPEIQIRTDCAHPVPPFREGA